MDTVKKDQGVRDQVALLSFIDDVIKEKKPPVKLEEQANLRGVLLNEVNEMINTRLVSLLKESDQQELETLMDKNVSDKELDEFFLKKIPNVGAEITATLLNFRAAYLAELPPAQ